MKLLLRIIILVVGTLPLAVSAQPNSPEQLISAYRAAVQGDSPEKLDAIFYTAGMTDYDKDQLKRGLQPLLALTKEKGIESISLRPLPEDFQHVFIVRGKRFEMTYPPKGLLQIKYKGSGTMSASAAYALVDGHYFLITSKSTDLKWSGPPDKPITFTVKGKGQDKVQIKAGWNASGVDLEQSFRSPSGAWGSWGQYFKSVTVTSTEEDTDVTLTVLENGKKIFVSQPMKGKGTIAYRKKS